jgi:hypothetical protein
MEKLKVSKELTWELLEIHNLLADTDTDNNQYGFNMLTDFIEKYCFATGKKMIPCNKCGKPIEKDIWKKEWLMCEACFDKEDK